MITKLNVKKIIITNIVALNGGDGAILFGMIKVLRKAFGDDCEIAVYASKPEVAQKMYPEIEFRETLGLAATRAPFSHIRYLGRIFKILQQIRYLAAAWGWAHGYRFMVNILPIKQREYLLEYANADLIVSSGGTYLKEEYGVLSQACDYRITLLLNRPLSFFTQSLGPFILPATRRVMESVFSRSSCIMLRDNRSLANIRDLGVTTVPTHLAADAAFALGEPELIERAMHAQPKPVGSLKVVISVRYWAHFASCSNEVGMARYRKSVAELVNSFIRQGASVTFLSTCQGIAEYDDDAVEAENVIKLLHADVAKKVTVVHEFIRFDDLLIRLQEYDLCIATRMHMCILALITGLPVFPIAYEFKTQELFNELGLGEWVVDIESIIPEQFPEQVQSFQLAVPSFRKQLFEKILALHHSAFEAGSLIRDALRKGR